MAFGPDFNSGRFPPRMVDRPKAKPRRPCLKSPCSGISAQEAPFEQRLLPLGVGIAVGHDAGAQAQPGRPVKNVIFAIFGRFDVNSRTQLLWTLKNPEDQDDRMVTDIAE